MGITEKGKKGFQKTPLNEQKNKRINVYLTNDEYNKFKEYCNVKETSQTSVLHNHILECIKTL
tara:strand:+ start:764 stop:952 length:189 start_codon:yes stop_codon:yes gene_type:complete